MGLDVYLYPEEESSIDILDWNGDELEQDFLFEAGITHNLNRMADQVNLYKALWRPEELNITKAEDLIPYLNKGLIPLLDKRVELVENYSPRNGYGSYEDLLNFVLTYLKACSKYPKSRILISR